LTTTEEPDVQSRVTTIDGTPLRWLEQGSGAPVVLVHGIPTSPALWRHVVPLLPDLRVLAFEMTGYGDSIPAGKGRDLSVSKQADRLIAWLDHLGLGPVTLVGHDLGGGVVHIAAVLRPDLLAGLMITNGIGYDSWPIPSVKAMRAAAPLLSRLPAVALKPAFGVLLARGHDDKERARESLGVHHRPYAEHGGGAAMARQVTALDVRDTLAVQDRLPSLHVPARV
jgi:pimeloyl-ACP methyl ester carboxylesterase